MKVFLYIVVKGRHCQGNCILAALETNCDSLLRFQRLYVAFFTNLQLTES